MTLGVITKGGVGDERILKYNGDLREEGEESKGVTKMRFKGRCQVAKDAKVSRMAEPVFSILEFDKKLCKRSESINQSINQNNQFITNHFV